MFRARLQKYIHIYTYVFVCTRTHTLHVHNQLHRTATIIWRTYLSLHYYHTLLYSSIANHELSTRKKEIDFDLRPWSLNINRSFFFNKGRA